MPVTEPELRALVSQISRVPPEKITRDAQFAVDLKMDSVASLDLLAAIEEDFAVEITQAQARDLQTYGQLVDYVTTR